MHKLFILKTAIILLFVSSLGCAAGFDQAGVTKLFTQMTNVVNSRNPKTINSFFSYYMASDAVVHKKSILVTPDDLENPQSIKDVQYTRDQYISFLQASANTKADYSINYNVDSFHILPDNYIAYAAVSIIETFIVRKNDSSLMEKNIVTTNCNYTMIEGANSSKIAGANCIEKIILAQ